MISCLSEVFGHITYIFYAFYRYIPIYAYSGALITYTSFFASGQILARVKMEWENQEWWYAQDSFYEGTMCWLGNDLTTLLSDERYESILIIWLYLNHMIIPYYLSYLELQEVGSLSLNEFFSIIVTPMCSTVIVPLEPLGG